MTGLRSKMLIALAAAGVLLAASPSYAFVAFACTAKDAGGVKSTYEYFGWFDFDSRASAASYAKAACEAKSSKPGTCEIVSCKKTHA